jgi:hypothetical protein
MAGVSRRCESLPRGVDAGVGEQRERHGRGDHKEQRDRPAGRIVVGSERARGRHRPHDVTISLARSGLIESLNLLHSTNKENPSMNNGPARRSSRASAAPESQTRPTLARVESRPAPPTEARAVTRENVAIRAAREADRYAELRVKQAEIEAEVKALSCELIEDMKDAGKERFATEHGLVSFLPATDARAVPDEAAAVALLESKGIPLPPTLEDWLARHGLAMPKKAKAGLPDRIEFRRSK